MPKIVWFNGEISPLEEAKIPAADHAHLYGDGLFEGIRIYRRKVFKLDEHLERLYHGITFLGFDCKISISDLKKTVLDVCKQANLDDGYVRLNVTRGTSLGLDPAKIQDGTNIMIMVNTLALYSADVYERGLNAITASVRTIPSDSLDPRLKCIGRYASNILAKFEANRKGADEALMLNHQGQIAECTGENIFLVQNKTIRTPDPSSGILAGITRNTVMSLAKEIGYDVQENFLTPFDLFTASEVFLTGTAAEIISLVALDGRKIGTGTPGPVTKEIDKAFKLHTDIGTAF